MTCIPTPEAPKKGKGKMNHNMFIHVAAIVLLMIGSAMGKSSPEAILAVGLIAFGGARLHNGGSHRHEMKADR